MPIELKCSSSTYKVHDASGYEFEIVTQHDPEHGWSASVVFNSYGMLNEDGAVKRLRVAVSKFLQMSGENDD